MSERPTPPLRRIVSREGADEVLECGHRQPKKHAAAMRRRCHQCIAARRLSVSLHEKAEAEAGQRCPYCFDDFSNAEEQTWTCPKCRTKLHGECHDENDGCTALGCRTRAPISVRPRITPTEIPQPTATERNGYEEDLDSLLNRHPPARTLDVLLASGLFFAVCLGPIIMGLNYNFWVGVATLIATCWFGNRVAVWRNWPRHTNRD